MDHYIRVDEVFFNGRKKPGKFKVRIRNKSKNIDKKWIVEAATKKEAQKIAEEIYSFLLVGTFKDEIEVPEKKSDREDLRFKDLADKYYLYLVKEKRKSQTQTLIKRTFNLHFLPILGRLNIREIGSVKIEEVRTHFLDLNDAGKITLRTANMFLSYLKACFNYAVNEHLLDFCPVIKKWKHQDEPIENGTRNQIITRSQYEAALAKVRGQDVWEVIVRLGGDMGLRIGEIIATSWNYIFLDAENPYLYVKFQITKTGNREDPKGHPKFKNYKQFLTPELTVLLKRMKEARTDDNEYVILFDGKEWPSRRKIEKKFHELFGHGNTHAARHLMLTQAAERTNNVRTVADMGRQTNLKITLGYMQSEEQNRINVQTRGKSE